MPTELDTTFAPRRTVAYPTLDAIVVDARRLVAAEATTTGNWSLAKILEHVAQGMEFGVDGFPPQMRARLVVRLLCRYVFKARIMREGMKPGFQLRGAAKQALVDNAGRLDAHKALDRLVRAVERLKAAERSADHFAFGPLSKDEAVLLHRRHAELHMSFVADK